jgi:uracil-DNA glycosylase
MRDFDPGPVGEPFAALAREAPGADVYPPADFRIEWGPIFHRGRLDGTARVLVVGQDPGQHESIAHRILVGEAGQRTQGFLRKLGLERSYAMINAYLYSVYGQQAGEQHARDEKIAAYRNRWFDALFGTSPIEAVISFGHLGRAAFERWRETVGSPGGGVNFEHLTHPTMPEASSHGDPVKKAEATKKMLAEWNGALERLDARLGARDVERPLEPYGTELRPEDRAPIPDFDLPAGSPPWWSSLKQWAVRTGDTAEAKRATIEITVPVGERPWSEVDPSSNAPEVGVDSLQPHERHSFSESQT